MIIKTIVWCAAPLQTVWLSSLTMKRVIKNRKRGAMDVSSVNDKNSCYKIISIPLITDYSRQGVDISGECASFKRHSHNFRSNFYMAAKMLKKVFNRF